MAERKKVAGRGKSGVFVRVEGDQAAGATAGVIVGREGVLLVVVVAEAGGGVAVEVLVAGRPG